MDSFVHLFPSKHNLLSLKEALGKLAQCERQIKTNGPTAIIQNANIVYSCLEHVKDLKSETIDEILHFLLKGLNLLELELRKLLTEKLNEETREKYLKTLKMFMYLIVEFSNFIEKKIIKEAQDDILSTSTVRKTSAKRKKQSSMDTESCNFDWNTIKEKILDSIAKILLHPIQKLWNPPLAEEQFVELITNMCYKLMENTSVTRNKTFKEHLCHILSIMIKKYNHSYGACVMIIQTLPQYEHLSTVYADLVQTCVKQLGYESILPELLRELRHYMDNMEMKTSNSKENPNIKFYSQFLTELGERLPTYLINYLSLLIDYLDQESYLMRNSILLIIGEIIINALNEENTNHDLKLKQIRNELLDTLCEHIHDCNALTRSKTLQIWRKICEEKKLPLQYQNEIMRRCVGRMEDVASSVRKSAFQLLCDMIKKNPYGIKSIKVSMDEIENEYKKEIDILNELKKKRNNDEDVESVSDNQQDANNNDDDERMETNEQNETDRLTEQIIVQTTKVNYLKDMITFIKQIETAIPKLTQLLFSKTQTDVIEVISFFVTCYEHGLVDMLFGIRKMLSLLLYAEKSIKDAVIDAYRRLYLDKNLIKQNPIFIVKQLIKLTNNLTVCEYEALEQLINAFTDSGEIDNQIIQILWEIFTKKSETNVISEEQSIGSLILLTMIIKKLPSKGKANIDVLIEYGLNMNASAGDNMFKIKQTCTALTHICTQADTKHLDLNEQYKLPINHKLFDILNEILVKNFTNFKLYDWISTSEQAINCIFKLADGPVLISEQLLLKLIQYIKPLKKFLKLDETTITESGGGGGGDTDDTIADKTITDDVLNDNNDEFSCNAILITRLMSLVGFIAIKLLVFLNTSVVCELKRRNILKENNENNKKNSTSNNTAKNKNKRRSKAARQSMSGGRRSIGNANDMALEDEMGLQGAEAEDAEQVTIENILETTISSNSLITKLAQFAVVILKEPTKYSNERLQIACSMALIRIMCLSRRICVKYLQLIFTIMQKFDSELVRSQLILGIGDLIYRFPNDLDAWTDILYSPLRDKSIVVRTNTIRVLSHLILKQMIKTRGQMYEIALCSIDDDTKISSLAKLFFTEFSKRDNGAAIYNILPDIISRLTNCTDVNRTTAISATQQSSQQCQSSQQRRSIFNEAEPITSEESFRQIVSYLFTFIKKEKQCETLIDKLAQHFKLANTERKCRDISFCLTKVNVTDSGLKKLFDSYKYYESKLCIPEVCEMFRQILRNAKKIATLKIESKKLIEEFEKKIDETLQKGLNDANNENAAPINNTILHQSIAPNRATNNKSVRKGAAANSKKKKKPALTLRNRKKQVASSSEEDESDSDTDSSSD